VIGVDVSAFVTEARAAADHLKQRTTFVA